MTVLLVTAATSWASADEPAVVTYWAVDASEEGRATKYFDPRAQDIRETLVDLPFDTYRTVESGRVTARMEQTVRKRLTSRYSLVLKPLDRSEDDLLRIELCIEMDPEKPGAKPIKVLQSTVKLAPAKKVKLRGLKTEDGELIVVLTAR